MKRSLLVAMMLASLVGASCKKSTTNDTDAAITHTDSGSGAVDAAHVDAGQVATDAGTSLDSGTAADTGTVAGDAGTAMVDRGHYIVDHVAACSDCHTPRNADGSPDMTRYLAGAECFIDTDPTSATAGCLHTRNLTNDPTGLMSRSSAEIKNMFQNGMRPDGTAMFNVMPYWVFHNMSAADADAVVAYLRTVPGVSHMVPANQAPFDVRPPGPSPALMDSQIPMPSTVDAHTMNGRYLATSAGVCIECHTQHTAAGTPGLPIMADKIFGGNEAYPAASLGLPVPPFPATIYSANITPDATGLMGWTATDVFNVVHNGVDRMGGHVCPPMPAGPMGAFGGLTSDDTMDIAQYIVALPPVNNMIPNGCVAP